MTLFPHRARRAFSLAEIAIALGVVAFALVSILGLLSVFFNVSKSSGDVSLLASMSRRFVEEMRTKPFAEVSGLGGSSFYFDADGNQLADSEGAWFECELQRTPNLDEELNSTLFRFSLNFRWPVGSASSQAFRVHSSVAKYE